MSKIKNTKFESNARISADDSLFVGVDMHKKSYSVAVWSHLQQRIVKTWTQAADACLLAAQVCGFAGEAQICDIVYEAGGQGFDPARALEAHGLPVHVISPAHIPRERAVQTKTDKIDCAKLATYAGRQMLHSVYVLSPQEEADRATVRWRATCLREVSRQKTRIQSFLQMYAIAQPEGLEHWSKASVAALRRCVIERHSKPTPVDRELQRTLNHVGTRARRQKLRTACGRQPSLSHRINEENSQSTRRRQIR